jgi:hypothetical protein
MKVFALTMTGAIVRPTILISSLASRNWPTFDMNWFPGVPFQDLPDRQSYHDYNRKFGSPLIRADNLDSALDDALTVTNPEYLHFGLKMICIKFTFVRALRAIAAMKISTPVLLIFEDCCPTMDYSVAMTAWQDAQDIQRDQKREMSIILQLCLAPFSPWDDHPELIEKFSREDWAKAFFRQVWYNWRSSVAEGFRGIGDAVILMNSSGAEILNSLCFMTPYTPEISLCLASLYLSDKQYGACFSYIKDFPPALFNYCFRRAGHLPHWCVVGDVLDGYRFDQNFKFNREVENE